MVITHQKWCTPVPKSDIFWLYTLFLKWFRSLKIQWEINFQWLYNRRHIINTKWCHFEGLLYIELLPGLSFYKKQVIFFKLQNMQIRRASHWCVSYVYRAFTSVKLRLLNTLTYSIACTRTIHKHTRCKVGWPSRRNLSIFLRWAEEYRNYFIQPQKENFFLLPRNKQYSSWI